MTSLNVPAAQQSNIASNALHPLSAQNVSLLTTLTKQENVHFVMYRTAYSVEMTQITVRLAMMGLGWMTKDNVQNARS